MVNDTNIGGDPTRGVPYSARQFPMTTAKGPPQHHPRRPRSPGLKWYKQYNNPDCFKGGRVLVIDYVKQGLDAPDALRVDYR